jgi:hypothetical protein
VIVPGYVRVHAPVPHALVLAFQRAQRAVVSRLCVNRVHSQAPPIIASEMNPAMMIAGGMIRYSQSICVFVRFILALSFGCGYASPDRRRGFPKLHYYDFDA